MQNKGQGLHALFFFILKFSYVNIQWTAVTAAFA